MKFEWENIYLNEMYGLITRRAKVMGGWVVRTETCHENIGMSESMVFIPDSEHQWEIEKE